MSTILDRVAKIADRFDELTQLMADPVVAADFTRLSELDRERQEIEELAQVYRRYAGRNDPASREPGPARRYGRGAARSWPNSKATA
jgi:protein subunit release factor A